MLPFVLLKQSKFVFRHNPSLQRAWLMVFQGFLPLKAYLGKHFEPDLIIWFKCLLFSVKVDPNSYIILFCFYCMLECHPFLFSSAAAFTEDFYHFGAEIFHVSFLLPCFMFLFSWLVFGNYPSRWWKESLITVLSSIRIFHYILFVSMSSQV